MKNKATATYSQAFSHFLSSTIGRASLLLGASIGIFAGVIVMIAFSAINGTESIQPSLAWVFIGVGFLIGLVVDVCVDIIVIRRITSK